MVDKDKKKMIVPAKKTPGKGRVIIVKKKKENK